VDIQSQINQKVIDSVVAMESAYTSIDVPQSRVDLEAQTIDADLNLKIKKLEVASKITGNIKSPNIKIDASKLLENKAKEKLEEKIKEKLGDDEDMNKLIKGLKSLF
jgi:glutaredoxin